MCNCINHKFLNNKDALLRIKLYLEEFKTQSSSELIKANLDDWEEDQGFNDSNFSMECL